MKASFVILLLLVVQIQAIEPQQQQNNKVSVDFEYKLGNSNAWKARGTVVVTSINGKTSKASFGEVGQQSFDIPAFKAALQHNSWYSIRMSSSESSSPFILSSVQVCQMAGSIMKYGEVHDSITVLTGLHGLPVGLNYNVDGPCISFDDFSLSSSSIHFKTNVTVKIPVDGVKPQQDAPPVIKEQPPEKSFFAKYWWALLIGGAMFLGPMLSGIAGGQGPEAPRRN